MWIYYLLLVIASVLFSGQFVFSKCYQKERGEGLFASLVFCGLSALVSIPIFFAINGFRFEFSFFSLGLAFLYTVSLIACTVFSVKALSRANLVIYSLFMMLGGMLLPLFYGLCIGEKLTVWKTVGIVAVILSMFITLKKSENEPRISKFAVVCFISVFICNGLLGIVTAYHQGNPSQAVSAAGFVLLCSIVKCVLSALVLLVLTMKKSKTEKPESAITKKSAWTVLGVCVGYAVVNGLACYFETISAGKIEAVVQFPIITGGCIFFSAVFGLLFGEKVTKKTVLGLIFVFIGTILIMF